MILFCLGNWDGNFLVPSKSPSSSSTPVSDFGSTVSSSPSSIDTTGTPGVDVLIVLMY